MKNSRMTAQLLMISIILSSCAMSRNNGGSQSAKYQPVSKELFDTIAHMDSMIFQAFNTCNVEGFTRLLTDDVEFYHDQGGFMLSSKTQAEGLRNRCAEQDRNGILRRELVQGSLEVYPINNYGAIETGVHNFYRTLNGQKEKLTTVAKFMNIWEKKNGQWKISRIISYGHQEM